MKFNVAADNLLQLTIQDVDTKELLTFDFSRFIGETGGDISKELPAIRANADVLQGEIFSSQYVLYWNISCNPYFELGCDLSSAKIKVLQYLYQLPS